MKGTLTILGIILCSISTAQNLVPNPSFEDTIHCPYSQGQIFLASPWYSPTSGGSPDYYNQCHPGGLNVPDNFEGFQFAQNGVAYCGLYTYIQSMTDVREYIQVMLSSPLIAGRKYCVTFYVNLAEISGRATDGFGAYLSDIPISRNDSLVFQYTPQISNASGNIISDTAQWVEISGIYVANGGEQYITIGNFKDDVNTMVQSVGPPLSWDFAYYFIDNVSLIEMVYDISDAGNNKMICVGDSVQIGSVQCNGCTYNWHPTTGLSDTAVAQPLAFPSQATTYYLTLTDTTTQDSCNCKSVSITTDSITIYVDSCLPPPPPEQFIEIYNIFTPNGDTKNDFFFIKNLPANSALQIFNRWGSRIFHSTNYNNKWDGGGVPDGTYYYILVLPDKKSYHGFVEIRR